jgi:hypothetical protein
MIMQVLVQLFTSMAVLGGEEIETVELLMERGQIQWK